MIRFGVVTERDASTGKVRVSLLGDDLATQMLPVVSSGSGVDKFFSLPGVGDQVAVLLDEHAEDGVVLGSIYSKADAVPAGATADVAMVRFADGTVVKYDKATSTVTIDAVSKVIIKAPENEVQGPLKVTGKITGEGGLEISGGSGAQITGSVSATGQVTANAGGASVSLSTHLHPTPNGPTSAPTPGT